jgi:uncharacterized protein (DUF1330 family)
VDQSINPTAEQIRSLRDAGPECPIVMVNLLKFREQADYPVGGSEPGCSGREAYARYEQAFRQTIDSVSRAEIIFRGSVNQVFIGQMNASSTDWDDVFVVRYPSREHFFEMMADPAYREALVHRSAGLERTILLQCNG